MNDMLFKQASTQSNSSNARKRAHLAVGTEPVVWAVQEPFQFLRLILVAHLGFIRHHSGSHGLSNSRLLLQLLALIGGHALPTCSTPCPTLTLDASQSQVGNHSRIQTCACTESFCAHTVAPSVYQPSRLGNLESYTLNQEHQPTGYIGL